MHVPLAHIPQHEATWQTPYFFSQLVEAVANLQNSEFQLLGGALCLTALLEF